MPKQSTSSGGTWFHICLKFKRQEKNESKLTLVYSIYLMSFYFYGVPLTYQKNKVKIEKTVKASFLISDLHDEGYATSSGAYKRSVIKAGGCQIRDKRR